MKLKLLVIIGLLPAFCLLEIAALEAQTRPVRAGQEELAHSARFRDKERELEAREEKITRREQELAEMEAEVRAELERLLELQKEARATLDGLTAAKDQAFRDLIRVYREMRPARVAELLDEMDDRDALEIMRGLPNDLVADILPRLERAKAVRLSRQLGLL
ncbi:MotE family protein [Desulfurivibrio alkaliphilus]|uniref:MgtE intracellular region n=1 Tax=Desulfurivibrio alkaliphilus (strain DSM 19089 / UNIQEM U267 / AHT2) TaxID=589865 RepID=D6Z2V6_DESAT|nr:MgtE intracellular region [Desulfurivibrio alkaliphilus]ADH85881.1 MgtE intracellular region [Desulfurivibrio alkaliphilus AHT 2]